MVDDSKALFFIRHGEALHNEASARSWHESTEAYTASLEDPALFDAALTERGRAQSVDLGRKLQEAGVDLVVASPMRRCLETALFAFGDDLEIVVLEDVRERHGIYPHERRRNKTEILETLAGRSRVDVSGLHSAEDTLWREDRRESWDEMCARAQRALIWLLGRPERRIAVVSHGLFLRHACVTGANKRLRLQCSAEDHARSWSNCEVRVYVVQSVVDARRIELDDLRAGRFPEPAATTASAGDARGRGRAGGWRRRQQRPKGQWLHMSSDTSGLAGLFEIEQAPAADSGASGGRFRSLMARLFGAFVATPQARVVTIRSAQTGMYVNLPGGKREEGIHLWMWDNPQSKHSQWLVTSLGRSTAGPCTISNLTSGMYIQAKGRSSGAWVRTTVDAAHADAHWVLQQHDAEATPEAMPRYRIRNSGSGKYLVLAPLEP
mmetsp:Transcript_43087/g.119167  ORF Transcript_43087/g.119167 Transcript_43087/m.119167 type:complete len:437 (-) Transcript_43087:90-1400(-)